jgi:hypothetical protein
MRDFLFLRLLKGSAVLAVLPLIPFANNAVAAVTTPNYVQGNYAVPRTPQTDVTLPYTAAQTAGNLNVVIVGWNDSSAQVSSLTDSNGNVYQLAVGPMVTGALSQAIYYAKNISAAAAATNSVTVTFNTAANYPDIRILEYSGIDPGNPVDTVVGAAGNSATSSSGVVTTTNATDLLVGANVVWTATAGPGGGFVRRLLSPDGDIVEDQIVTATGSYSASAPLTSTGPWIMQMAAFRAGGSAAPTPTPTPGRSATPAFVQGNFNVPVSPANSNNSVYTKAQNQGNCNLVWVWTTNGTTISNVTDTAGNTYTLAYGPVIDNAAAWQVDLFICNGIKAAAAGNTVTAHFTSANWSEVINTEYQSVSATTPIDVRNSGQGISQAAGTAPIAPTGSNETVVSWLGLIYDNIVGPVTVPAGWAARTTSSTTGSSWTADQSFANPGAVNPSWSFSSNDWTVINIALNAGAAPSPTPTPTPAPTPTPTPTPAPTPAPTPSSTVTLAWSANIPTSDPATNTTGYKLYIGLASGNYTQSIDVGNKTTATVSNLISGTTYYSVITAYNSAGLESLDSNEVSYLAP